LTIDNFLIVVVHSYIPLLMLFRLTRIQNKSAQIASITLIRVPLSPQIPHQASRILHQATDS